MTEQRVQLPDGRVGVIVEELGDMALVRVGRHNDELKPGRIVADIEETEIPIRELKEEWTEIDKHGRVFNQDGKQVAYDANSDTGGK